MKRMYFLAVQESDFLNSSTHSFGLKNVHYKDAWNSGIGQNRMVLNRYRIEDIFWVGLRVVHLSIF